MNKLFHLIIIGSLGLSAADIRAETRGKKLIEWGWDQPTTSFMRKHISDMEKMPFDGCVFGVQFDKPNGKKGSFTWDGWGKRAFEEKDLAPALADLKATKFTRFTDNFLRFNTTPADLDWFDDYSSVINNARLAARFVKQAGCKGVMLDNEQYNFHLFDYRKQRDKDTKSGEVYAAQVHKRAFEVMTAMQEEYPDIVVFLPFGYSMPWLQIGRGKEPNEKLAERSYGLVLPFVDGLVEAANGKSKLIDGDENAYGAKEADNFVRSRNAMKKGVLAIAADPEKYLRVFTCSFGLWPDNDWRKHGWDVQNFEKNFYTPEVLERVMRAALDNADEYVWVYTEKLRWWTDKGTPEELPDAYEQAVRRVWESTKSASGEKPASRPQ